MGREIRIVVAFGVEVGAGGGAGRWNCLGRGTKELQGEGMFFTFGFLVEYGC